VHLYKGEVTKRPDTTVSTVSGSCKCFIFSTTSRPLLWCTQRPIHLIEVSALMSRASCARV